MNSLRRLTLFQLDTPRLLLVHTPLEVIVRRLEQPSFVASLETRSGPLEVHFPPEWPGEALGFFAEWARWKVAHPLEREFGGGTVVHTLERRAIGQLGFKGPPDEQGSVEIGYGIAATHWGQGYATEMVRAQVGWALEQNGVYRVWAECLEGNLASRRVLEKSGFARCGERYDPGQGGWLERWERF